jgi:hypothetical protein
MARLVALACLLVLGAGLQAPKKEVAKKNATTAGEKAPIAKNVTVAAKSATKKAPIAKNATVAAKNATKKARHNVSNTEKLGALFQGLKTLKELRTMFQEDHQTHSASKFANGALSDELASANSGIWDTIDTMIGSTVKAQAELKDKSKEEQSKLMDSLEEDLDTKAGKLNSGLEAATKKQQVLDAEYVLGLLMMHRKDWDMKQQLNATAAFMKDSPILQKLHAHHDSQRSLAAQLAELMDTAKKQKQSTGHVAARLFLQLASHFRST